MKRKRKDYLNQANEIFLNFDLKKNIRKKKKHKMALVIENILNIIEDNYLKKEVEKLISDFVINKKDELKELALNTYKRELSVYDVYNVTKLLDSNIIGTKRSTTSLQASSNALVFHSLTTYVIDQYLFERNIDATRACNHYIETKYFNLYKEKFVNYSDSLSSPYTMQADVFRRRFTSLIQEDLDFAVGFI